MQTQAIIKQLTPMEVFDWTLHEVRKAIGDQLDYTFEIKVSDDDTSPLSVLAYNVKNPNLLAVGFVKKNKTTHVVCFPAADTDKVAGADIPLSYIAHTIDANLKNFQDLIIKKHMIVSVYGNLLSENHFVAITEINNKLTVVNPKGMISALSNPDMDYLEQCIPDISSEPLSAGIQEFFDTERCGYLVAAIHAKTIEKDDCDFAELMQTINVDEIVQAYAESKITPEYISIAILRKAHEIELYQQVLTERIKDKQESMIVFEDPIIKLIEKNLILSSSIYCLAGELDVSALSENEGHTAILVDSVKELNEQKLKFPNHAWPNLFKQLIDESEKEKNDALDENDFDFVSENVNARL